MAGRVLEHKARPRHGTVRKIVQYRCLRARGVKMLRHPVGAAGDDTPARDHAHAARLRGIVDRGVGSAVDEGHIYLTAGDIDVSVGIETVRVTSGFVDDRDDAARDIDKGVKRCLISCRRLRVIRGCARQEGQIHGGAAVGVKAVIRGINRDIAVPHRDLLRLDALVAGRDKEVTSRNEDRHVAVQGVVPRVDRQRPAADFDRVIDVQAVRGRTHRDSSAGDHQRVVDIDPVLV